MLAKTNVGYRTFGINLPELYDVTDEDQRHTIYQNFIIKYEALSDTGDFDNEMYWFTFSAIEKMTMRMPGGRKDEWKAEKIF